MQTAKQKVDGKVIVLAGKEFTLPPLPLAKMPKIKAIMNNVSEDISEEFVDTFVNAIFWSLQRNYGEDELQHEFVASSIDLTNWQAVQTAFMEVNGFASVPTAGAPTSGEAEGAKSSQP